MAPAAYWMARFSTREAVNLPCAGQPGSVLWPQNSLPCSEPGAARALWSACRRPWACPAQASWAQRSGHVVHSPVQGLELQSPGILGTARCPAEHARGQAPAAPRELQGQRVAWRAAFRSQVHPRPWTHVRMQPARAAWRSVHQDHLAAGSKLCPESESRRSWAKRVSSSKGGLLTGHRARPGAQRSWPRPPLTLEHRPGCR